MRYEVLVVLGVGMGSAGCAGLPRCMQEPRYVLVERADSEVRGLPAQAEVTETDTYKGVRTKLRTVALRLPDNCFQHANLGVGMNVEAATLESSCGVPLQVLESTLTKGGFHVLSWSTLMGIERQQGVPVHIAAQQIGADFVIIINKMYAGKRLAGDAAEATYRYFDSDPRGERHERAELFQGDRAWLKDFIRARAGRDVEANGHRETLQAELNATVLLVHPIESQPPTAATEGSTLATLGPAMPYGAAVPAPVGSSGESIWFYSWSVGSKELGHGTLFLFGGIPAAKYKDLGRPPATETDDPNLHYWWPLAPNLPEAPAPRDQATSEERFSTRVDVGPGEAAVLSRKIAEDFIQRFKGG